LARLIVLALAALVVAGWAKPASAQTFLAVTDQGLPAPRPGAEPVDFVFVVNLTDASGLPDPHPNTTVQVGFTTVDGGPNDCDPFACAKAGKDYVQTNGVLTFPPGVISQQWTVPVLSAKARESNEAFFVLLLTPQNAIFQNPFGLARITQQVPPRSDASKNKVTEHTHGFIGHPGGVVVGPDNNFWMTEQFDGRLVTFDPQTLMATEFPPRNQPFLFGTWPAPLPPYALVHFVTTGPDIIGPDITPGDSNLWFTTLDDQIGTFDLATKEFRMFRLSDYGIHPFSVPHFIQNGGDGFFYFSLENEELFPEPGGQNKSRTGPGRLARISIYPPNIIQDFPGALPPERQIGNRMHGLTIDADGNIWAGLEGFDEGWRFNRDTLAFEGPPIQFPLGSGPHDLMLGPDNNVYVVLQGSNQLGRFNPSTGEVRVFDVPGLSPKDGPSMVFLALGPDKTSLWFSEFVNDRIGRFDLITNEFTEFYRGIQGGAAPIGIVTGPDGNIWFTEAVPDTRFPGRIGRLIPIP